jgi:hypothetical protein
MKLTLMTLTLLMALILNSCQPESPVVRDKQGRTWEIFEIDSCEYIYAKVGYGVCIAHKCNCKFCEQRRKMK